MHIHYINRLTGKTEKEEVYYEGGIRFLYGKSFISRTLGRIFLHGLAKWPLTSWIFGKLQQRKASKKKVVPFINLYNVDTSEFLEPVDSFSSFNAFFIRKLKPSVRPLAEGDNRAIIPADARYYFYETVDEKFPFSVKGQNFTLKTLLQDDEKAARYTGGTLVIARLCPTDCHRFYFPCDSVPGTTKYINGKLFSVNPIAIQDNPWIYCVNRRCVTYLESNQFGTIAYLEIGATSVGSIIQTFTAHTLQKKGAEKGYFSFGSALLLLFEKGRVRLDADLVAATKQDLEMRALIGQPLGIAIR